MAYTPTNWQNLPDTTTPVVAQKLNNMETGIKKSDTVIGGDEYDSTSTYEIGDFCIYNNKLYRCITAIITAEAFTPAHWEETSVENELDALRKSGGIPTNSVIGYDGSTIPSGFEETDGPNDYSTTEKVIGTWTNGETLYRRVYQGTMPTTGDYIVLGNIPNLEIVRFTGSVNGASNLKDPIPFYWSNTSKNVVEYNPNTGDFIFTFGTDYRSGTQFNNKQYKIIVEYLKVSS